MIGFSHPAMALALQLAIGLLTGNYWYGFVLAFVFVGREIAQAEYRWIERFGGGRRSNMPWWGGFDPRVWTLHSITDWILPLILTALVAITFSPDAGALP